MSKQNQIRKLFTKTIWIGLMSVNLFLIILAIILYLTVDSKIVSSIYFVAFFIFSIPIVYAIFQWNSFKRKMNRKYFKDTSFMAKEIQYRNLIDEFYNNVIYDMDALLGAFLRKVLRYVLFIASPAILCLLLSSLVFVL